MQLILIRHGLPENAHSRSVTNPALSTVGRLQAKETCERLAREPIKRIISSPLVRAVETGAPLAERLKLPICEMPDIGEVDNGEDVYISTESIKAAGEWDRFMQDPIGYYGHNEEEFRTRVLNGFAKILADPVGGRVAIFTHAFPINIILSHALQLPRIAYFSPRNGSVSRLMGRDLDSLAILSVNETSHFSETTAG